MPGSPSYTQIFGEQSPPSFTGFSLVSRYIQECVHTCTQSSLKWRVLYLTEKGKVIITT